jgi:hypothetical protein
MTERILADPVRAEKVLFGDLRGEQGNREAVRLGLNSASLGHGKSI